MTVSRAIKQYIDWKRSAGLRFDSVERFFESFGKHIGKLQLHEIKPRHVRTFLDKPSSSNEAWQQNFEKLALFFRYHRVSRNIKRVPLPKRRPCSAKMFVPYVYSRREIRRMTNRKFLQKYLTNTLVGGDTFRAFLLFLYGTGVFFTEALTLQVKHLDLAKFTIMVRRHEDHNFRTIPIGHDVVRLLSGYLNSPKRKQTESELVFVTIEGKPISPITIRANFKIIRRALGIVVADTPTHQPRMHDLRHTFAVHRITSWYEQGVDLEKMLPALACYLGRVGLRSTERDFHLTPLCFRKAVIS
jgi:integrase/recombinase XerD